MCEDREMRLACPVQMSGLFELMIFDGSTRLVPCKPGSAVREIQRGPAIPMLRRQIIEYLAFMINHTPQVSGLLFNKIWKQIGRRTPGAAPV